MKIVAKPSSWEHEPWTVIRVENGKEVKFYAKNCLHGQLQPARDTYEEAYKDIPIKPYAEPWGV